MGSAGLCVCGHELVAHEHFRRGSDCSICGEDRCPRFLRPRPWRRPLPAP